MSEYNGASIMWMVQRDIVNEFIASDASLQGVGGYSEKKFFHCEIPQSIRDQTGIHIAHFELWAIIIAVKIWKDDITGQRFVMGCDNQAVVTIVNTGRSRDELLQTLLRELVYVVASSQAEIVMRYVPSGQNLIPDLLSRWSLHPKYQQQFEKLHEPDWKEEYVTPEYFNLVSDW